jgi:hypothetical protein
VNILRWSIMDRRGHHVASSLKRRVWRIMAGFWDHIEGADLIDGYPCRRQAGYVQVDPNATRPMQALSDLICSMIFF